MLGKDMIEPVEPHLNQCRAQSKEDDTRVRLSILEDEFAKMAVISDENPAFPLGEGQYL